jgi:hypothetical protein
VIFCPQYGRRFKKQFETHDEAREYCGVLLESIKHLTIAEIERFISSQEFTWGQKP